MQCLQSPILMSLTAAWRRYGPKMGKKIRILTRCNRKINARTDPRSDILQVSGQASCSGRSSGPIDPSCFTHSRVQGRNPALARRRRDWEAFGAGRR